MKSINLLTSYLRLFGVLPILTEGGWNLSIISNFIFYAICLLSLSSTLYFFAFTAQIFSEYVETFYYITHSMLMLSWYSVYLTQRKSYGSLIVELDEIIEKRKVMSYSNVSNFGANFTLII